MVDGIERVVVIGAGQAGVEVAATLRQKGFAGTIDLVSGEPDVPYQRPPLSKEYIKFPREALVLKPAQFYGAHDITLRLGVTAEAIDRAGRAVQLSTGERIPYDHLVLATGARNRRPPVPGLDDPAVVELRTLADARRIVSLIGGWRRVCVVGGGFIGLEAAGLLRTMDIAVDVVEMAPRFMQRAVSPGASAWFLGFHRDCGVSVHLSTQVTGVAHRGGGASVRLSNDSALEADAVLLAAGIVPNVELAAAAGLKVDNGIVVDDLLRTEDPAISAIGDCAAYPSAQLPGMVRLESVQNATDQGRAVAGRLTGEARPYDSLPWFWSIQGEARLQIAGLWRPGLDEVVRGDPAAGKFSIFLYDGERLAAVESVNAAGDHMAARKLLGAGLTLERRIAAEGSADLRKIVQESLGRGGAVASGRSDGG
jgi:3-phenylpropionate/trans-cinnamate dioxygenase ferredoxin reductase subunit